MSDRGYMAQALQLEAESLKIKVESMKADNKAREMDNLALAYDEVAFMEVAYEMNALAKKSNELVNYRR